MNRVTLSSQTCDLGISALVSWHGGFIQNIVVVVESINQGVNPVLRILTSRWAVPFA